VTPDGRQVVAISSGALRSLNLADGKETVRFEFPENINNSWAFGLARDGQRVIVGSDDVLARVFDVKTGKLLTTLRGHTSSLWGAALLPNGTQALTGSGDGSLRVWDVASGRQVRAFENVPQGVQSLDLSPDGKLVAVGHALANDFRDRDFEAPGTIRIWDLESGREVRALNGHSKRLSSVRFSADGKLLLSSGHDKTVRLWDVANGKLLKTFEGHTDAVEGAVFTTDGRRILSIGGQRNPVLKMWDIASGSLLYQTPATGTGFLDIVALADGRHCLTCGKDGAIRLWQWKR
jgi:WD40 repeat protein